MERKIQRTRPIRRDRRTLASKSQAPKQQRIVWDLRPNSTVPAKILLILPYIENLHRAPAAAFDDYLMNLNSLFDPNRTGTGHQPLGYDQWSAFYGRYRVNSVRYEIELSNTATTSLSVAVAPTNSVTLLDLINASEMPQSQRVMLGPLTGNGVSVLRGVVNLPWLTGRTKPEYQGSDQTNALVSASPADAAILHIVAGSFDGSNVTYDVAIRLWFDCEFLDRVELVES